MGLYKRPESPYWHYAFTLNGHRILGSTRTYDKKLAEKIYFAKRAERQRIDYGFEHSNIRLGEMITEYINLYAMHSKISFKDNEAKLNKFKSFFGNIFLHEITPQRLEEYRINRLSDGVSKSTVNREMGALKHMFTKAIEWGKASKNPVKMIRFYSEKERARIRYLQDHEKVKLLNACPPHTKRLVYFALNTGMRQGEILGLKWSDLDFSTNLISIRHSKSGRPRYVPMNSDLVQMLKGIPSKSIHIFGTEKGKPQWTNFRRNFESAVRKAGLTDFRYHDLRHCFASDLVMKGVNLKTVSEILGHATTQMTERYSHLDPAVKLEAVEKLSRGLLHLTDAPSTVEKILNDIGNPEEIEHRHD